MSRHFNGVGFAATRVVGRRGGGRGAPFSVGGGRGAPFTVGGGCGAPFTVGGGRGAPFTVGGDRGAPFSVGLGGGTRTVDFTRWNPTLMVVTMRTT